MTKMTKMIAMFVFTLGCGMSLAYASQAREDCLENCNAQLDNCSSLQYYCIRAYKSCVNSCPAV
jgi:hypothetical protein